MPISIRQYIDAHNPASPSLIVDCALVAKQYEALKHAFPYADCHYAVKANPAPEILKTLCAHGSRFDTASLPEIEAVLAAGARPDDLIFGNTIKLPEHIFAAHKKGVRRFVFDCHNELEKLSKHAPGSRVYCRIAVDNRGAAWPLAMKFGCSAQRAFELLVEAKELGLEPYGLSFHVGSQQTEPTRWDAAIALAASLFERLQGEADILLQSLNIGGGFPAHYRHPVPDIAEYGKAIHASLNHHFSGPMPHIMLEPGRYLVADAGVLLSRVVTVRRDPAMGDLRWVYLDVGKFSGLVETEAIEYEIHTDIDDHEDGTGPVVLAGPTCDSVDVIYETAAYALPRALDVGDRVYFLSAGAYTTTYASIGFNGFPPLKEIYM